MDESSEGASDVGQYVGAVFRAVSSPFGSTVFFTFRVFSLVLLMPDSLQVRRYGRRPPPHARRSHTQTDTHKQTITHTRTLPPHTRSRHVSLTGSGVYPPPFLSSFHPLLHFFSHVRAELSASRSRGQRRRRCRARRPPLWRHASRLRWSMKRGDHPCEKKEPTTPPPLFDHDHRRPSSSTIS